MSDGLPKATPLADFDAQRGAPLPTAVPLSEFDAQQPGFLDATRAAIRGEDPGASLPVNIGAEIVANLPTEIGAAAGMARGLMAPQTLSAVQRAAISAGRALPAGPVAALGYGLAGGAAGALAEQSLQQGEGANTLLGFANPLANLGAIPAATQDAMWSVAGGMGFPLLMRGMGNMGRGLWNRIWGTGTPGAEVLETSGIRGLPSQMTPEQRAAFNERAALSEEFNVPYTFGELSADRALMQNRESIMRALPGSADPMFNFLRNRARQIQESVVGEARNIADITPYEGFTRAGQAARDTVANMFKQRRATTRKMYNDIWKQQPQMNAESFIAGLQREAVNEEAGLQKIFDKAIADIQSATKDGLVPAQKLHNIQSRYNATARKLNRDAQQQRVYSQIGQGIKAALDRAMPEYREVSNVYRQMSDHIDKMRTATKIGEAASVDRVNVADTVQSWFQGGRVYPEEIRDVKRLWRENLPTMQYVEATKGLQSAFLRNVVENIRPNQSGESVLNVGGKIAQALGGDPTMPGGIRISQMMDELYTVPQRQKLNRMLRMLDDTSQILSIKSPTQPRLVAEEMQRTVGEDILQELGQGATEAAVGGTAGAMNWLLRSSARLRDKVTRRRAREMDANTMYANVLNEGTTATIRHFDQLERAVRKARELPPEAARAQLARAWGTVLGVQINEKLND